METFLARWAEAALTTLGFFWMALWAFCLGYLVSSMIQVFVTEQRMQRTMGEVGPRSVALGTFFGFVSSSCSFAPLSTSRALFQKGAGLVPALAFLLASTNLVIELGILIFVFLSWHFVVGEYLGGLLLIGIMWAVVRLTGVFLFGLVSTSLLLHAGFAIAGALPDAGAVDVTRTRPSERFRLDYTFALNLGFLLISAGMAWLARWRLGSGHGGGRSVSERLLLALAAASLAWLGGGVVLHAFR